MRFILPALFAFVASTSVNANALRQYQPRSLDSCANVHSDLVISGKNFGKLKKCLCVSGIPAQLGHDALKKAVLLYGTSTVIATVTTMIHKASDHKQCYFPDHSSPECDEDNPCHFECEEGFKSHPEYHPTSCVCEYPRTICNGECGEFEHCGSQKPKKRDAKWRDATCRQGWSACRLWGASADFECVDVTRDLWSCGGCGTPLLPTDPTGIDCTAIPGVHDVSCLNSHCVVSRCKDGFEVSPDQTTCISTTRTSPNLPVFFNHGAGSFKVYEDA